MEAFTTHEGLCATLSRDDVDTDQIIPKQFLKRTDRGDYGDAGFFAWRYDDAGHPRPDFELNDPVFQGASILITGRNFGCGSSREHAVWALLGMGFRAVIAPSFADIFTVNSLQNGLLPVELPALLVAQLSARAKSPGGHRLTVDLPAQQVRDGSGLSADFVVDPFWKKCLLSGRDPIAMALSQEEAIAEFEGSRPDWRPVTTGEGLFS
ncbi:MAG TPA: 3-isopropylmalate dehydratase small subunit [Candidatus Dormibacteraeota bacterium]|nr:3-isopropylmalate dehydratase small subunit [Candidatus Dormibacteraeota bacterium]